jgi:alpha-glucosidase
MLRQPTYGALASVLQVCWRSGVRPLDLPRSDGDDVGDLPSITARLDHLAGLGVDAVSLTPFYRSRSRLRLRHPHHTDVDPTTHNLAMWTQVLRRAAMQLVPSA